MGDNALNLVTLMSSKMLINAELGWSTLRGWSSSAKG
jgi:hypothetical protein